jgi:hypothetical protein
MRRYADYASDGRDGCEIARTLFDQVIGTLRRDQRFRGTSIHDFDLLFADLRGAFERDLVRKMRDRVHLNDLREDEQ